MELANLILSIILAIGRAISDALSTGDISILDKRVSELLPRTLRTSLSRALAEEKARRKFGPPA